MTAKNLHEFDLRLCGYLTGNIIQYMDREAFRADLETVLASRPLLQYLHDRHVGDDEIRLLLNNAELGRLESVFEDVLDRLWEPIDAIHRRYAETIPEVRENISRDVGEQWSQDCARFAKQLANENLRLSEGITVIREWLGRLRTLLRVMGAVAFIPQPEGAFPTPTHPEPRAMPEALTAISNQRDKQEDSSEKAILVESLALQREMREILVNQRTVKDWYSTDEIGTLLGKAEYTIREWCRQGRVHAEKKGSGRGKYQSWVVSHAELLRIQKEGLLPAKN